MKKHILVLLCLALGLFIVSSAMATYTPEDSWTTGGYVPGAGINGSVHDLSKSNQQAKGMTYWAAGSVDVLDRICIFCHTPHHSMKLTGVAVGTGINAPSDKFNYLPLWNHEVTGLADSYQMYVNGPGEPTTGDLRSQAIDNGMTPGSTSLLCLSCHDGTVAVNSYGSAPQPVSSIGNGDLEIDDETYLIGKDGYLGNHHPIGFDYEAVQGSDKYIRDSGTEMTADGSTIADHLYGEDARLECGTCHSVHNKGNSGERLLWRSDIRSALCLTCHDKGSLDPNYLDPTSFTP
ncbi:MAG: hypothetical protein HZA16_03410 [Nitrospirae bacterium]|nr:hypothetical protein [Nitrospirota bacterium]